MLCPSIQAPFPLQLSPIHTHVNTYRPHQEDRLGRFPPAITGIVISGTRLIGVPGRAIHIRSLAFVGWELIDQEAVVGWRHKSDPLLYRHRQHLCSSLLAANPSRRRERGWERERTGEKDVREREEE